MIPADVSLVNRIADEIERRGHWQGQPNANANDGCCVLTATVSWGESGLAFQRIAEGIGLKSWADIPDWNDTTDTEVVLKTLRSLHADE